MATTWAYAIAKDGSPLFYEAWGDRRDRRDPESNGASEGETERGSDATPVLLCDGIGCDGYVWRYLREDLTDRVGLHPHYRGHGRTAAPRDPARVTIEDLADDVAAVLDDATVPRAVLIGHSMGVQVALETYRRHPDRVAGLILVCGAPSHPLKTFRGSAAMEDLLPLVQRWIHRVPGVVNRLTRTLLPTRLAYEVASRLEIRRELVEPNDFMPYLEGMARIDARLFVAMLTSAAQHSADDLLPTIKVPTLVVAGARDGFTPPDRSRAMAEAIPDAELLEIEGASHTAPIERPALIDSTIRDFVARRIDSRDAISGDANRPG